MSGKRDQITGSIDLFAPGEKFFNLQETLAFLRKAKELVERAKEHDGEVDAQEAAEIFATLLTDLDPVRGGQVKGRLIQVKVRYGQVCAMLKSVPSVKAYIEKTFPAFFTVFSSDVREVSSDDDVQAPAPAKLSRAKMVTSRASGAKTAVSKARKRVPARKSVVLDTKGDEGVKSLTVTELFPPDGQPSVVEQQERDVQERALLEKFMGLDDGSSSGQEPDSRLADSRYVEEIARILVRAQADAARSSDGLYQAARAIFIQRFFEQTPEEYLAEMEDRRATEKNLVPDADKGVRDTAADDAADAYAQRALAESNRPSFEMLDPDAVSSGRVDEGSSRQEDAHVDNPNEALPELEPTPLSHEDQLEERTKNIDRVLTELSEKDFWKSDAQLPEGIVRLADFSSDEERKRFIREEIHRVYRDHATFDRFSLEARDKDLLFQKLMFIENQTEGLDAQDQFDVLGFAFERQAALGREREERGVPDGSQPFVRITPNESEDRFVDEVTFRASLPVGRSEPGPAPVPNGVGGISADPHLDKEAVAFRTRPGQGDSRSLPSRPEQKEGLFTRAKKWAHGKHEELAASSDVYRAHVMGALTEKEAREQAPTLSYKAMIAGGLVSGMLTRFGVAFPVDAIRYVTQRHFTGVEREEITQAFQAALAERRAERQEGEEEDPMLRNDSLRRRVASSRYLTHAKKEELMRELEQQLVFFSTGENKIYNAQYTGGEVGRLLDHEIRTRVSGEKVAKEFVNTSLKGGALVATAFGAAPLAALGYQFLRAPSYGAISVYGRWHRLTRENPESSSGERLKAAFVGGFTEWFDGARGKQGRLSQAAAFGTAARFAGIGSTFVEAAVSSGAIDSLLSAWEGHEFTFPEDLRNLFSGGVDRVEAYVSSLASSAEERVSSFADWVKESASSSADWVKESASSSYDRAHEQVTSAMQETHDRVSSFTEESSSPEPMPEPVTDNVPDAVVVAPEPAPEPIVSSVINPDSIPHEAILGRGDGITQVLEHAIEADHSLLHDADRHVLDDDLQRGLFMRRLAAREGLLDYWLSDKAVGQLAIIPQYEGGIAHIAFLNPQTGESYSIAELKKLGWLIKAVKK